MFGSQLVMVKIVSIDISPLRVDHSLKRQLTSVAHQLVNLVALRLRSDRAEQQINNNSLPSSRLPFDMARLGAFAEVTKEATAGGST